MGNIFVSDEDSIKMQVYVGDVNNITETVEFPLTFAPFLRTALRTCMGSEKAFSFPTGAKKEQWLRLSRATGGREEGGGLFYGYVRRGEAKKRHLLLTPSIDSLFNAPCLLMYKLC